MATFHKELNYLSRYFKEAVCWAHFISLTLIKSGGAQSRACSGTHHQRVVAAPAVVDHGDQPAGDKQPDHHKPGVAKIIV